MAEPAYAALAADDGTELVTDAGEDLIWIGRVRAPGFTVLRDASAFWNGERLHLTPDWSAPIELQLLGDGRPLELFGCSVVAVLRRPDDVTVEREVTVVDPTAGVVAWQPAPGDLPPSGLVTRLELRGELRLRVTDPEGGIFTVPSARPLYVYVRD